MASPHQVEQLIQLLEVGGQYGLDRVADLPLLDRAADPRIWLRLPHGPVDGLSEVRLVLEEVDERPFGAIVGPVGVRGVRPFRAEDSSTSRSTAARGMTTTSACWRHLVA